MVVTDDGRSPHLSIERKDILEGAALVGKNDKLEPSLLALDLRFKQEYDVQQL